MKKVQAKNVAQLIHVFNSFHTDASASGSGFRMEWYVEGCGGKLYHPQGSLTSPGFPKKYRHELTCLWEIDVEFGFKIEFTIHEIDLEQTTECLYDFLEFAHDPSFNTSFAKFCASQHNETIITSSGHKLFVRFIADDSNNGKGFNMSYKSVVGDCGGKFAAAKGIISTPNYPTKNYDDKMNCEWNIKTDPSHSLSFQFMDFDLEESPNCTKDRVEIFDPIFDSLLWKGCGNQMPNQTLFKSNRNELIVRLISDDSITAKGFSGNFSNNCGARITVNESGEFVYRRSNENLLCTWSIIAADPAKKVMVTFTYVNIFLETTEGCMSTVEVFDGDTDSAPIRTRFCGSKTPPAIFSNGNALTIKLNVSSHSYISEFDVNYSVLDNGEIKLLLRGFFEDVYNRFQFLF